jgi:hypothetical protein
MARSEASVPGMITRLMFWGMGRLAMAGTAPLGHVVFAMMTDAVARCRKLCLGNARGRTTEAEMTDNRQGFSDVVSGDARNLCCGYGNEQNKAAVWRSASFREKFEEKKCGRSVGV